MPLSSPVVYLIVALAIIYTLVWFIISSSRRVRPPLPPGPKGFPLLGNLNNLPKPGELEAHHWLRHKELYGWFYKRV